MQILRRALASSNVITFRLPSTGIWPLLNWLRNSVMMAEYSIPLYVKEKSPAPSGLARYPNSSPKLGEVSRSDGEVCPAAPSGLASISLSSLLSPLSSLFTNSSSLQKNKSFGSAVGVKNTLVMSFAPLSNSTPSSR